MPGMFHWGLIVGEFAILALAVAVVVVLVRRNK